MLTLFVTNLSMGASPVGTVTILAYPDPLAATATVTVNPLAATSRLKGS